MGEYKEYDNLLYVTVEVVLKNGTDLNQVKDNLTVENLGSLINIVEAKIVDIEVGV